MLLFVNILLSSVIAGSLGSEFKSPTRMVGSFSFLKRWVMNFACSILFLSFRSRCVFANKSFFLCIVTSITDKLRVSLSTGEGRKCFSTRSIGFLIRWRYHIHLYQGLSLWKIYSACLLIRLIFWLDFQNMIYRD